MSRTYRKRDPISIVYTKEKINDLIYGQYCSDDDLNPIRRDRKSHKKPGKLYKRMKKKSRKAKEKQAFIHGIEDPHFKKTDVWDYN